MCEDYLLSMTNATSDTAVSNANLAIVLSWNYTLGSWMQANLNGISLSVMIVLARLCVQDTSALFS